MNQDLLLGLVCILAVGFAGQLMAGFFRIPAILVLLTLGVVVGPLTGILNPEKILGPLLLPVVSLSVAVILFEGGLSLRLRELRDIGKVFFRLITVGVLATWLMTTIAAHYILGFRWGLSVLFGAILVVTGPTVIIPLLRHVRLSGKTGALLKWEGIFVDPVGAIAVVLVFEALHNSEVHEAEPRWSPWITGCLAALKRMSRSARLPFPSNGWWNSSANSPGPRTIGARERSK